MRVVLDGNRTYCFHLFEGKAYCFHLFSLLLLASNFNIWLLLYSLIRGGKMDGLDGYGFGS